MEFHHLHSKEFAIGMVANRSWAVVKAEVLKCELLCSNCHRTEHSDRENPRLIAAAETYRGKKLE